MNLFSPNNLLTLSSVLVIPCWLLLLLFPHAKITKIFVKSYFVPLFLSASYLIILISEASFKDIDFSTLESIYKLFANPYLLLAGWIHYLAFDLFVGIWILEDAKIKGISHKWLIIPLLFTFYFGPIGFLSYNAIRFLKK